MRSWPVLALGCMLAVSWGGCLEDGPMGGLDDPMARTTFRDGGSNDTAWRLVLAGDFHLPTGTRFHLEAANTTCTTRGLVALEGNTTLPCHQEKSETHLYDVLLEDRDVDGRLSRGDRLEVRAAPGAAEPSLLGNHTLTLALHEALPIFVLRQHLAGAESGPLDVTLLG